MPWPLGEASNVLVHPGGLEPSRREGGRFWGGSLCPSATSALLVPERRIERRLPPYQGGALPLDDCGPVFLWCWLEHSNPPPRAYKASALPDELSQPGKLTKGARRRSRCESERA